jgi:hypothetical protein
LKAGMTTTTLCFNLSSVMILPLRIGRPCNPCHNGGEWA